MGDVKIPEIQSVRVNLKVKISKEVFENLEDIQKNMGVYERCGLFFGTLKKKDIHIVEMIEIENVKRSSVEFELDPIQALRAFEKAEEMGLDVVGVWHTHPEWIAYPSNKDRKGMEIYPGIWVIISKSEIKAYFGNENGFFEVSLEITGSLQ